MVYYVPDHSTKTLTVRKLKKLLEMVDAQNSIKLIAYIKNEIHKRNGILLNLYLSGSDLYGWRSRNSDIDIRGTYILDKREFLGLKNNPKDTIQLKGMENYDIDLFEAKKSINLGLKGNCTILEGYYAPQLYALNEYNEIAKMLKESWGKGGVFGSYHGMAEFNYKKFIAQGRNTIKKYLYVFRGLLAGRYALDNGSFESDMNVLLKYYREPLIKKLLKFKKEGKENEPLRELNSGELDKIIIKQFKKLDESYNGCAFPVKPDEEAWNKMNKLLIQTRLDMSYDR
jgi:predicted nucleotidyltransferase